MDNKKLENGVQKLSIPVLKKGEILVISACRGQCRGKNSSTPYYNPLEIKSVNQEKKVG
ncbi:hypothetical protein [Anaerococcus sp. Marseille-Q7828]|uniref:hypothetical protein n=1 Tax=Anaerococcus sp. Marseille-Q7828 TaxID=3036300 RepID=UPI0024ADE594|nr:hypothetical protein [Anaerococcus sp. Marseille-Q7828]